MRRGIGSRKEKKGWEEGDGIIDERKGGTETIIDKIGRWREGAD